MKIAISDICLSDSRNGSDRATVAGHLYGRFFAERSAARTDVISMSRTGDLP
jgi:hypothetical protein